MLSQKTIARLTGVAYFWMLPGGIIGFLVIRPRLIDPHSAASTLTNILTHDTLARAGFVAALVVIVAQALTALGFYALWRESQPVAAFGIAGFGLVNAAAIFTGTAASWTALQLAEKSRVTTAAPADLVHALYQFDGAAWQVGGIFFGLWLIPMGVAVLRSGYFHLGKVLGWTLIAGGAGYLVSTFLAALPSIGEGGTVGLLTMPATIGELWMVVALLTVGVREPHPARS